MVQYIRIQLPGKPSMLCIHLFDKKKKENVKLGSYMWGAKFYYVMFDKVYLNKFKVEISSLPRR